MQLARSKLAAVLAVLGESCVSVYMQAKRRVTGTKKGKAISLPGLVLGSQRVGDGGR